MGPTFEDKLLSVEQTLAVTNSNFTLDSMRVTMDERILRLVSHPIRRRIIWTLRNRETPIKCPLEIADLDSGIVQKEVAHRRQIELFHIHLPKLDDADVIVWDRDHENVSKGSNFDECCILLDVLITLDGVETDS